MTTFPQQPLHRPWTSPHAQTGDRTVQRSYAPARPLRQVRRDVFQIIGEYVLILVMLVFSFSLHAVLFVLAVFGIPFLLIVITGLTTVFFGLLILAVGMITAAVGLL